ncbi:MAG: alpha/beta hydrolase [bacterium]|nr:alpha/beta hydrolase [bacterium]
MLEISHEEPQHNNITDGSVESFGGESKFVDIQPSLESQISNIPVIVAGGWSETPKSLQDVGEEITSKGRRTILVEHARSGGKDKDQTDYPPETQQRANTLLVTLDKLNIDKADIIAHSEGALDAVFAAMQSPERFRSLILVAPAGMIGEDSIPALSARFSKKIVRGWTKDARENPKAAYRLNTGTPQYVAKNPVKAIREIKDISSITIEEALTDIKESGVNVSIIQSQSDQVFPSERINKNVVLGENVDRHASVVSEDAGHDDLIVHPERSTRAALQMIDQFEEDRQVSSE